MRDFVISALVYVPAYFAAHWIGDRGYVDPVLAGWLASVIATMGLRYEGPAWIACRGRL